MMLYLIDCDIKVAAANIASSPKDIVCMLCECLGDEDKVITKKDGTKIVQSI